ncbi:hypothetical protein H1164_13120 [Thermoactinomyces daqus]|uniref:Uncharacterized protein n=1 Tax=Thermoactinomyces daqus TaxID=1329516 RepID=A0A7W1XBX3_9BACL|nr:hypothetical protein [Thermoactinomyces daqus]MBA4543829.1 hypothetical protein [Thermoactinomyces daqus]
MKRDLKKDLKIITKATPGPWQARSWSIPTDDQFHVQQRDEEKPKEIATAWQGGRYPDAPEISAEEARNNAIFIAESREGWPEAIRRAMVAEEEVERLRAEIQRHIDLMESSAEVIAGIESGNRDFNMGISAAYRTAAKNLRKVLSEGETYRCIECGKPTENWVEVCGECIEKALREEKPGDF